MLCDMFIIATIQRTGSTMLSIAMNSHPEIRCFGELFLDRYPNKIVGSYQKYVRRSTAHRISDLLWKGRSVKAYLNELRAKPKDLFESEDHWQQCSHVGFKLMLGHAHRYPVVLRYARSHDIPFIHLVRKNLLKTEISRVRNFMTKTPHLLVRDKKTEAFEAPKVQLDPGTLIAKLATIERHNNRWTQKLARRKSITIYYEELVRDPITQINRIHAFLNLFQIDQVNLPTRKISPSELAQSIENYDEIVRLLSGTPYEAFLSDD